MPASPANPGRRSLPSDQLMIFRDSGGGTQPVRTPADWRYRRADIVQHMEAIMGPFPSRNVSRTTALDVQTEQEIDRGSYVLRRITYTSDPGCRTPAWLCLPQAALTATDRSFPAVLCLHPTNFEIGAGVVVGLGGKGNRQYAAELAERGYVTVAPAYPHLADYTPDLAGLGYASGTMKAIQDNTRALDVLESLPCVHPGAFGAIGHSLGGHNAVFTAVFEPRIAAVVASCGLDAFPDYMEGKPELWAHGQGWCQDRYMPRLAAFQHRLTEIPFDFHEIVAALAPRPVLISAPLHDGNFRWQSVDRIAAAAQPVFGLLGSESHLQVVHPDCDHDFPSPQREMAFHLFDEVLRIPVRND